MTRVGPKWIADAVPRSTRRAPELTLPEMLSHSFRVNAPRVAIVDAERTFSYADVDLLSARLAALVASNGTRIGDPVAFIGSNSAAIIVADLAIARAGFARVGLSPRLSLNEVKKILVDCEATTILADHEWTGLLAPEVGGSVLPVSIIDVEEFVEDDSNRQYLEDDAQPGEDPAGLPPVGADPSWISYLFYTSGTTGDPKGGVVTQSAMVSVVDQINQALPVIDGRETVLHVAPLAHFSGVTMLTSVVRGGRQVTMRRFSPDAVLDTIEGLSCSLVPLVPTMLGDLVEEQSANPRDLSTLDSIFYVGSAISVTKLRRALEELKCGFVQSYALTEAPLALTALTKADHEAALVDPAQESLLASAGRPLPGVRIAIEGADGRHARSGEAGEILVRSNTMMTGYWRNPEATQEVYDEDGWLHTGDVGYLSEDGYLYITDRIKEMIVTGGFNVYPTEIERVVHEIAWVIECAVVGVPDPKWGEAVALFLVADVDRVPVDQDAARSELVDYCRQRIARYKVPKQIEFVRTLPRNANGKISRRSIRDRFWDGRDRKV